MNNLTQTFIKYVRDALKGKATVEGIYFSVNQADGTVIFIIDIFDGFTSDRRRKIRKYQRNDIELVNVKSRADEVISEIIKRHAPDDELPAN